jgi:8-oxo-dGTP pyrophosphatase MutT (NUDIX family)
LRIEDAESRLTRAFGRRLPGPEAQKLLAPRPRKGWQPGVTPDDCRHGAGLLLLYPEGDETRLLLTKRNIHLPQHAGQVSLPGGAVEASESIEQGALREAQEEVGLDPDAVRLLGQLSPLHIPVSRFVLHPVVAVAGARPELQADVGEVERLLEGPLSHIGDARNYSIETREFRGGFYRVPFIPLDGEKVWGATAMVLAEFLVILGYRPDPWGPDDVDD